MDDRGMWWVLCVQLSNCGFRSEFVVGARGGDHGVVWMRARKDGSASS